MFCNSLHQPKVNCPWVRLHRHTGINCRLGKLFEQPLRVGLASRKSSTQQSRWNLEKQKNFILYYHNNLENQFRVQFKELDSRRVTITTQHTYTAGNCIHYKLLKSGFTQRSSLFLNQFMRFLTNLGSIALTYLQMVKR